MKQTNVEIERKFIVSHVPFELSAYKSFYIEQSYIYTEQPVLRLRKKDNSFFLTVKAKTNEDVQNNEFEIEISEKAYNDLLKKVESNVVKKTRYLIPLSERLVAELDVYNGALNGLLTVEVEFESLDEAQLFVPPNWFGDDVSSDNRFKNNYLATFGLPQ